MEYSSVSVLFVPVIIFGDSALPGISPMASFCSPSLSLGRRLLCIWEITAFIQGMQTRRDASHLQIIFPLFPPMSPTPHVVCAAWWLLSLYQEVVLFIPYVALLLPWSQKGTISAAACGSGNTEPGRFHRTLWTAMFHDALLWISEDSVFKMTKIQF